MTTAAAIAFAIASAIWAVAMYVRSKQVTTIVESYTVRMDILQHERLWLLYRQHLGGVTDRFMSWCDAVAEAEGDLERATIIHRVRYPDSLGSGMPSLPFTATERDRIVTHVVDDLRRLAEESRDV